MNTVTFYIYLFCMSLIRAYKWGEFQVLKLFTPLLQKKGKQIGESIGVIYHCPGDPEWTIDDEKRVLASCKYDTLVHLVVHDPIYFPRMANSCTLASGETFMDGIWECRDGVENVTEYVKRVTENNILDLYWNPWNRFLEWIELSAFNLQTSSRAFQVGKEHYDLGNDLYEMMLDPWMQYTCGYWAKADNLNQAQLDKMELIAKKLDLKPGMRILDIGCGWGYLCKYLATHYKVECVGITISEEGVAHGKKINEGLNVEIRLQDYREVNETFDRIVSVGMFEHVGTKNYTEYFQVARRCLTSDGIFLLHTIGRNHPNLPPSEPWLNTYIFPNGLLPDVVDIAKSTKGLFILEDWHNFGPDYATTLQSWRANFLKGWPKLESKYGERFFRMWVFYLSMSAGAFLSRKLQLWQVVLSADGLRDGGKVYRAAR